MPNFAARSHYAGNQTPSISSPTVLDYPKGQNTLLKPPLQQISGPHPLPYQEEQTLKDVSIS